VHQSLTDVTSGEVVAVVAKYLAHQDGVDVRVRETPSLDDPIWERIQAGPDGALYDLKLIERVIAKRLEKALRQGPRAAADLKHLDTDKALARLRLFCRIRGISLPYAPLMERGARAAGFAAAIEHISTSARADLAVVISDLGFVEDDAATALRAMARAKQGGRSLVIVAPFAPAFADEAQAPAAQRVASIVTADERARFEKNRRLLQSRGVPVFEVGPQDSLPR